MARDKKLIQFYLTSRCNSRCKTCNIWKGTDGKYEDLPYETVAKICLNNKDADFVFGGGEYTLYSGRHRLLRVLDGKDVNYTILSNAVSLPLLESVIQQHDIKNLTMSCDGVLHDEIRGVHGNLFNIATILDKYIDKIPNIKLSYTYSKYNEKYFIADMDYIKKVLGFDKVYFCIAQDMDLLLRSGESVKPNSLEQILERSDMLYDKDRLYIESLLKGEKKPCDSTGSVFTVYSNGNVVLCQSFMSKCVLGNIYESDFNDIIDNVKVIKCSYDKKCNLLCQRRYD